MWRSGLSKMVVRLLPTGWEQAKLLDVGTADGYTIRLVKPSGEILGIDTDPTMATPSATRGIEFREGSAYEIPAPDKAFDLVTLIEVAEHLERPYDALKEVRRVLREGGSAVITTPVPKRSWRLLWWAWTKLGPGKRWENTPHVSELHMWGDRKSPNGLATMLRALGFTIEKTDTCNLGYVAGVRARREPLRE
jgi:ubiquinone/menaquinone biosynthesis C-methylase UbiE